MLCTRIFRRFHSTSAVFKTKPYSLHKLDKGPESTVTLTRDDGLLYYTQMKRSRLMEQSCQPLFKEGFVNLACHLYSGQEACAVGIVANMDKKDKVITSYRGHVWTHLLGATVAEVLAEITGRATGIVNGKSGSMHMYTDQFFGGNAILCGQVPNGGGMALSMKLLNEPNMCVNVYGDGTANQGMIFETFNMAKLWNLPCLFVIENNRFGKNVLSAEHTCNTDYYTRGDYVPGIRCDGIDVLSVREAVRFAREYMMSGKGPLLLELQTENHGHTEFGTGPTRFPDRDPIIELKNQLLDNNLATEQELIEIDKECKDTVDRASASARKDEFLPEEGLYTDVYHNTPNQKIRDVIDEVVPKYTETCQILEKIGKPRRNFD